MQIGSVTGAVSPDDWSAQAHKGAAAAPDAAVLPVSASDRPAESLQLREKARQAQRAVEEKKTQEQVFRDNSWNDDTKINFKIHKETGAMMIQIISGDTGEIIREIPPEKLLDSIGEIWKNAGIRVDKKI